MEYLFSKISSNKKDNQKIQECLHLFNIFDLRIFLAYIYFLTSLLSVIILCIWNITMSTLIIITLTWLRYVINDFVFKKKRSQTLNDVSYNLQMLYHCFGTWMEFSLYFNWSHYWIFKNDSSCFIIYTFTVCISLVQYCPLVFNYLIQNAYWSNNHFYKKS